MKKNHRFLQILLLVTVCFSCGSKVEKKQGESILSVDYEFTKNRLDFRIRDPFVFVDTKDSLYYMYASVDVDSTKGVGVYVSKNLEMWDGPFTVFRCDTALWGNDAVWAPEVHLYNGKYYLFVTITNDLNPPERFINDGKERLPMARRGTSIMVSDCARGPFKALKPEASHTPIEWMALDGTLFIENNKPYMVFCHEWVQIDDGTIEVVQLKDDLSDAIGDPTKLFSATEAQWVLSLDEAGGKYHGYITDGPFFYRTRVGSLIMGWSSFGAQKYAIGLALSESGSIYGPWKQLENPLFEKDGGHGMLFTGLDGKMYVALHQPNGGDLERAHFYEVEECENYLQFKKDENVN